MSVSRFFAAGIPLRVRSTAATPMGSASASTTQQSMNKRSVSSKTPHAGGCGRASERGQKPDDKVERKPLCPSAPFASRIPTRIKLLCVDAFVVGECSPRVTRPLPGIPSDAAVGQEFEIARSPDQASAVANTKSRAAVPPSSFRDRSHPFPWASNLW